MQHETRLQQINAMMALDFNSFGRFQSLPLEQIICEAERYQSQGDSKSSAALYKNWIAGNPANLFLHAAYFNYGVALAKSGDHLGAINATRECIRLKPDFQPPYINLGRLLEDAGQSGDAIKQWLTLTDQLREINGTSVKNKLIAFQQVARVLESHQLDVPAEDALRQALEISIHQPEVIQHWIALRQRQCKWPAVEGWEHASPHALMAGISPLSLANLLDDPMFQLARASKYSKDFIKPLDKTTRPQAHVPGARPRHEKLRIGYVSSDFREHAVGFAMTDVMEEHNRERFEIYAYYCGIARIDPTRRRIEAAVDHWLDINGMSDELVAARIREDEIDILIDLNGYTKDARTRVFAHRPSPIAVNWFGFPGTMGSPYHHYIVADDYIIPSDYEIFYSEKVVRLPCYQPNDRKRVVSPNTPVRADEGLPDDAVVFCCLNGMQKITPRVFEDWMTILSGVPNSVLWLLGGSEDADNRLKAAATTYGIAPERLIFSQKKPNPEHLARYALADLFLDTFPYGAHTTAADAMWMGVPILTVPGQTFASRVCASVITAAGIGELVCPSREAYVVKAIELGRNPQQISALREQLLSERQRSRLFDTPSLVRNLETLYGTMWDDFEKGALPIPNLSQLDLYHEIGVDLAVEGAQAGDFEGFVGLYREQLERRNALYPLPHDQRLWPHKS